MQENIDKHIMWNDAAKGGLVLGLFSGLFIFVSPAVAKIGSGFLVLLLNAILWTVKFVGCIWLMRRFMLHFYTDHDDAGRQKTFTFGMLIALTSSIIVSGASLLNMYVISPDIMQQAVDNAMQSMPLSSSDKVTLERTLSHLPQISFFVSLGYCFLYGTAVSKIISIMLPPKDEFGSDTIDHQESENN